MIKPHALKLHKLEACLYKWIQMSWCSAVWNDNCKVFLRSSSQMNQSKSWMVGYPWLPLFFFFFFSCISPSFPSLLSNHYDCHKYNQVCCCPHCRGSAVSSQMEELLQLLPLSRWLDLMILSEYSDILEHSIWQRGKKQGKKQINWPYMMDCDALGRISSIQCVLLR